MVSGSWSKKSVKNLKEGSIDATAKTFDCRGDVTQKLRFPTQHADHTIRTKRLKQTLYCTSQKDIAKPLLIDRRIQSLKVISEQLLSLGLRQIDIGVVE